MRTRILPLFVVVLFLLTACQNTWNNYTRIYVQNATADSFQVFITYPPTDTSALFKIKSNQTRFISSYYLDDEPGFGTTRNTDIWLYNYNDTTWTLLSNYNANSEYTDRYRKYISVDDLKIKALNPNYNDRVLTLTINENLLDEMTQDKLLTDSVFGVR